MSLQDYNFKMVDYGNKGARGPHYLGAHLGKIQLTLTKALYLKMGSPAHCRIGFDRKKRAILLIGAPSDAIDAYKVVKRGNSSPFLMAKQLSGLVPIGRYYFEEEDHSGMASYILISDERSQ